MDFHSNPMIIPNKNGRNHRGKSLEKSPCPGDYMDYLKIHDLPLLAPKAATSSALPYDTRFFLFRSWQVERRNWDFLHSLGRNGNLTMCVLIYIYIYIWFYIYIYICIYIYMCINIYIYTYMYIPGSICYVSWLCMFLIYIYI